MHCAHLKKNEISIALKVIIS